MGSESNGEDDASGAAAPDASSGSTGPPAKRSRKVPKPPQSPKPPSGSTPDAAPSTEAGSPSEPSSADAPSTPSSKSSSKPSSKSSAKSSLSTTSSAKSRAATRKVDLGKGNPASTTADASGTATKAPRKAKKPPFYKRGGFWFLVVVAEVVVALLISYRFERTPDSVDLSGTNLDAFCADVAAIRAAGQADTTIDVAQADATFRRQRDAYVKLKQSAPEDLQPDLDRLIKAQDQLIDTTQSIQKRKLENPEYANGVPDLLAAEAALDPRLELPNARLELAVRNACHIELDAPATTAPPTTAPAPGVAPPGSGPPGTTPSGAPPPGSAVTVPTSIPDAGAPSTTAGVR